MFMRMPGRLTRLFWADFLILCYLVWNFHNSVLPIKRLRNSFLQKLSEFGPTYANFVTSVSHTYIMLNIVYMFLFFSPLHTGFWLDRSSTPELALLLAVLSLLSEAAARCSSCPYTPKVLQIIDIPASFGSTHILFIISCHFVLSNSRKRKINLCFLYFSLVVVSISCPLIAWSFLKCIVYLSCKAAHCILLNSKFCILSFQVTVLFTSEHWSQMLWTY